MKNKKVVIIVIVALVIIISILLVLLGTRKIGLRHNDNSEVISEDNEKSEEQQFKEYNAPFESYKGDYIYGSEAKALCDLVRSHNVNMPTNLIELQDEEETAVYSTDINTMKRKLRNNYKYKVELEYETSTKYVKRVKIILIEASDSWLLLAFLII